jgi:hypothetical protein
MEQWFVKFYSHLAAHALREHTPWEIGRMIHEALEIAEAEKYATEKSRFEFVLADSNERDLRRDQSMSHGIREFHCRTEVQVMPVLDEHDLREMRTQIERCEDCLNFVLHNYCRECDEFYVYGHDKNCKWNSREHEKHEGHRTY